MNKTQEQKIAKALKTEQAIIVEMPSAEYNDDILQLVKLVSGKKVCYVTLNKTHPAIEELFVKKKTNVKKFIFIDAISKTLKKTPDQKDNCYFVSSPNALTELSIIITKFLKQDFDYLIFDSLSVLAIYERKEPISKFVSSLINKVRETKTKALFYAVESKEQEEMVVQCSMFVDDVIKT